MKRSIAFSIALTSILALSNSQPAKAIDFQKTLKNYVDKNVLKKDSAAQSMTKNNINMQMMQLENQIKAGVSSGKITSTEATELNNELAKVKQSQAGFLADTKYTDPEVVQLLGQINALKTKITSYESNSSTGSAPAAAKPAPVASTPAPAATPAVAPAAAPPSKSVATNTLYQRIANSLAAGKINRTEASNLFKVENRIHDLESKLRMSAKGDYDKQRSMFRELEQLTHSIDTKLAGK